MLNGLGIIAGIVVLGIWQFLIWPVLRKRSGSAKRDSKSPGPSRPGGRQPIFARGAHYRCLLSFQSGPSSFEAGEVLTFLKETYSRYDTAFVYEFRSDADGQLKYWLLSDGDTPLSWTKYFESL